MTRSNVRSIASAGMLGCLLAASAWALGLADLTNQEASSGIRGALTQGASSAISKLGVPGGFSNNPKVRIELPHALEELASGMRMIGRGKDADELVASMNQAAEQAVPQAKPLLIQAVKSMSLADAKSILTGGDNSVTNFFREKTSAPLAVQFLPIVKRVTDQVGLAQKYDKLAGRARRWDLSRVTPRTWSSTSRTRRSTAFT